MVTKLMKPIRIASGPATKVGKGTSSARSVGSNYSRMDQVKFVEGNL